MKEADWQKLPGRRCALCGKGQSPRLGSLAGMAGLVATMRAAGVRLALPDARYMHVRCVTRYQSRARR